MSIKQMVDVIARARGSMVMDKPFFADLAFKLGVGENKDPIPATDGVVMEFNPEYVAAMRPEQVKGCVAALSISCGLGHPFRRGGRDAKLWSYVCNCISGDATRKAGFELPNGWPLDGRFTAETTTAEEAYRIAEQENPPTPNGNGQQQGQGQGQQQGRGGSQGQGQQQQQGQGSGKNRQPGANVNTPSQQQADSTKDPSQDGDGEGGSDGDGDGNGDGDGEGEDCQGQGQQASPDAQRRMEEDWKIRMVQAAQTAKRMGNVPGWMKSILDDITEPQVDWRSQVRQWMVEVSKDDYSFSHPSRRYSGHEVIFPGMWSEDKPRLVMARDTSGSVTCPESVQGLAELNALLEEFDMEIWVLMCDTRITSATLYTRDDLPIKDYKGGGGTDFRPPFEWVEQNLDNPPSGFIYFSDMGCNSFPVPPTYPVLWVSTGKEENLVRSTGGGVPFGEVVYVKVDRKY